MKKRFPLQKVLEHRERVYNIKLQELDSLRSELQQFKNEKIILEDERKRVEKDIVNLKNNELMMKPLYDKYLDKVKKAISSVEEKINTKSTEIENKKKEVVSALNDKKIMEKLKEKHIIDYRNFLKKEELKLIDELVITRHKK